MLTQTNDTRSGLMLVWVHMIVTRGVTELPCAQVRKTIPTVYIIHASTATTSQRKINNRIDPNNGIISAYVLYFVSGPNANPVVCSLVAQC